jgi:hypothetical protein
MGSRQKVALGVVAVLVVLGGIAVAVVSRVGDDGSGGAPVTTRRALPGALVVKVDNAPAARPQTGIGTADVVYVEPVEGGVTRFAAVYLGEVPAVVGPVRSARETDLELLAQYGTPVLAFSGAAPELAPLLDQARLTRASPQEAAAAYTRDRNRQAPHNLYVHPEGLPEPERGGGAPSVGPAPAGGRPAATWSVGYPAAAFDLAWSAGGGGWAISVDGVPLVAADSGAVEAANVVVQRVPMRAGRFVEDASGAVSPVAGTVGSGPAAVLRDGVVFEGSWSRPTPDEPTGFATADGADLPLAPGRTWVFLVPM